MTISHISPATLSKPAGYSHVTVVSAGKQIHVSGQVALNAAGEVVGKGDVGAQAEQVYVNLTPEKAAAVRAVRMKYLGDGPYPASTMVGVTALVTPDLLVEIEANASGS